MRISRRDLSTVILFMVFVNVFPFYLFISDLMILKIIRISINFVLSILLFFFVKLKDYVLDNRHRVNLRILVFFIPALLACVSNYFNCFFVPHAFYFRPLEFVLDILLAATVAFNEEIIFRLCIQKGFSLYSPIKRVLFTTFIYSAFNILRFISTTDPIDLLYVINALVLGLITGLMFEYSRSILVTIGFHFLYSFLNEALFAQLSFGMEILLTFILTSLAISVLMFIYLFILYWAKLNKEE